jgi:hypothetical protein
MKIGIEKQTEFFSSGNHYGYFQGPFEKVQCVCVSSFVTKKLKRKKNFKKNLFFLSFVRRLNLVNDAEVGRLGQGRNERTEGKIYKKDEMK